MNHIELFAGCGGLSLGLESAGFELLLANELSPMAGETFAYNFFRENLAELDLSGSQAKSLRTKWLSSRFKVSEMADRLREDPRTFPSLENGICDAHNARDLKGSLIIGSIVQLNTWLSRDDIARETLKSGCGAGEVDLVSGGPPCQSFSMAGMREYTNARNILPKEFANFVQMIRPKMALLENVTGILRPFEVDGEKIHAWFEVAKAFVAAGYVPLCLHVNAKFAGVAQNRPRFVMILLREDVCRSITDTLNKSEIELLAPSVAFYRLASDNPSITYSERKLSYFDAANAKDLELFKKSFLRPLVKYSSKPYSVLDAIDDLKLTGGVSSNYVSDINHRLRRKGTKTPPIGAIENHAMRRNSEIVKRRFRIYQVIRNLSTKGQREVQGVLSQDSGVLSDSTFANLVEYEFIGQDNKPRNFGLSDKADFVKYLAAHHTKKQTQKSLHPAAPAPAALSIPDDACHYDELRTLSVREMARIQSFPDSFVFRSKVTTGGQMRKFEVPQYTQVGNAVPPILGRALGMVFKELLERASDTSNMNRISDAFLPPTVVASQA